MSTIQAQPAPRKQQHRAWLRRKMWQYKSIYLMIVPVFLYFAVFTFTRWALAWCKASSACP